ncbi:hypothetical protein [Brevibacillus sp. H7]|uniref:hypothetical protein n=1 Tax=Brevibacillus sp. H7 TaxID=3349138 RepID=UPI0038140A79
MNKSQFLRKKSAFYLKHPEQDDLFFYRSFVEQYPDAAIGWFHLGREWELRGQEMQALSAYRKALHTGADEYAADAREAYHQLLRKRRNRQRSALHSLRQGQARSEAGWVVIPK